MHRMMNKKKTSHFQTSKLLQKKFLLESITPIIKTNFKNVEFSEIVFESRQISEVIASGNLKVIAGA